MSDETVKNNNILMEKRKIIAPEKSLGGMTVSSEKDRYIRTYQMLFCPCGDKIDEDKDYSICKTDNSVTCKDCSLKFKNKNICVFCFKKEYQLEKFPFMVLKLFEKNITKVSVINKLTKILTADISDAKKFLESKKYITKKFLSPFQITASGIEILNIYENNIYQNEKDIINFIERIKDIEC